MSVKFKDIDTKRKVLIVEIDVANTKNIGATLEAIDIVAAENGLLPHTIKRNFPVLNKHKGLTDELQFDILGLITEKIELERDIVRQRLEVKKTKSISRMKIKSPAVRAEINKIIGQERLKSPRNFWKPAQARCVDYLSTVNKDLGKWLDDMAPKEFSEHIRRQNPKKK